MEMSPKGPKDPCGVTRNERQELICSDEARSKIPWEVGSEAQQEEVFL